MLWYAPNVKLRELICKLLLALLLLAACTGALGLGSFTLHMWIWLKTAASADPMLYSSLVDTEEKAQTSLACTENKHFRTHRGWSLPSSCCALRSSVKLIAAPPIEMIAMISIISRSELIAYSNYKL
mmetsp:Transcript_10181/g.62085  ORF Transcript_10181/g.62085 Transcript_10181/m.62085 type:complete len:127 (+) Transcript_10181:814-1194(+)